MKRGAKRRGLNRGFAGFIGVCDDSDDVTILCKKDEGDYFSQNFVYISRTTTTRHMVSFIDFYFHFQANFQT